ncbi:hypothetical protein N7462_005627 [Penicillium macrosclerotiorum]|uniref:uncharacterized protein n=1 Tax=Penicillium macrosclerotiorum TaxID=303699 RepID=UPI002547DB19|nr:uncharacterized protein N7462_005627 [Penicillium macrosclerotiorum]KAJ5682462.1 hypothetical protein N7462_005627 [Penicillium macrosclerotiorum]
MTSLASFELPKWIETNKNNGLLVLAGSATPALSIEDLIQLSSDKQTTASNLSLQTLKLTLSPFDGSEALREKIATLYNAGITAEHILPAQGTTGANTLVFQSLLSPSDHVIAMYPSYQQLLSLPTATAGVEASHWILDLDSPAHTSIQALKALIRPTTKMIILNNPNNPLGTVLSRTAQAEIVALAAAHNLTLLVDEIFRPLFHDSDETPLSFVELPYQNIIVTSSMSKAWGLSGARVGWLATRSEAIRARCFDRSLYTIMALSTVDELIATEALSERCRPAILAKHLALAQTNLALLDGFVDRHRDTECRRHGFCALCAWGVAVDDVAFCRELKEKKGVLLAPGSLCFGLGSDQDFRGFVRVHITVQPEVMQAALAAIGDFLEE